MANDTFVFNLPYLDRCHASVFYTTNTHVSTITKLGESFGVFVELGSLVGCQKAMWQLAVLHIGNEKEMVSCQYYCDRLYLHCQPKKGVCKMYRFDIFLFPISFHAAVLMWKPNLMEFILLKKCRLSHKFHIVLQKFFFYFMKTIHFTVRN